MLEKANIIEFTTLLSYDLTSGGKYNNETKLVANYIRIFSASFCDKISIHKYTKKINIQHYLRDIPIKGVIKLFPYSGTELSKRS